MSDSADDVRRAYFNFLEDGLFAFNEQILSDSRYSSNKDGHFAWDVSLYVRAACRAWEATNNSLFLRYATYWSAHLCERTDLSLGLTDWRGRSKKVWSAGARYTAGIASVGLYDGIPIRVQAAADAIVVVKSSSSTARVSAIRNNEVVWAPPEGSLDPESDHYLPDVLSLNSSVHSLLFSGLKSGVDLAAMQDGEFEVEPQIAPHLVHTGLIARSLLDVARTLEEAGPGTIDSALTPSELFSQAECALEAHSDEIVVRAGEPWYVTPDDFPGRRLGMELPHNQVADAATCAMIIGRRNEDFSMAANGVGMARRFVQEVAAYNRHDINSPWNYYPTDSDSYVGGRKPAPLGERIVRPAPRSEDSSHATMRARALADWMAEGSVGLSARFVRDVSESFRALFVSVAPGESTLRWLPEDPDDSPREGTCDAYAGAWGALVNWDPPVRAMINDIASRNFPSAYYGATVMSAAELVVMNTSTPRRTI